MSIGPGHLIFSVSCSPLILFCVILLHMLNIVFKSRILVYQNVEEHKISVS